MSNTDSKSIFGRRHYLASIAAGSALVAGCSSGQDGSSSSDGGGGETQSNGGGTTVGNANEQQSFTIGVSNFTNQLPFEVMVRTAAEWYGSDLSNVTVKASASDGSTTHQIQDIKNLLRQNIDGLIVTPTDSNGLASTAESADVPVFTADIPINSDAVKMHTGVSQQKYGFQAGQELVATMKENYPDVSSYKVLEILMDQNNSNAVLRHRYFNQAIDQHDDAEVVKQIEINGYSSSDVASKATTWLQSDPDLHGVFAPWTGGPIGVIKALQRQDRLHKVGDSGHVTIVSADANATIIDYIKDGYIDKVVDQPVMFYCPLSIHYMLEYLKAGEDSGVLPSIGEEISKSKFSIDGGQHMDIDPWSEQLWAPANIREFVTFNGKGLGFPFFTTNIPRVTTDNADAPYLWGNITRQM